jgi:hypothetical protein
LFGHLATVHTDFDEHGAPIRASGIFRDVTARRKAEEEAERLSERVPLANLIGLASAGNMGDAVVRCGTFAN